MITNDWGRQACCCKLLLICGQAYLAEKFLPWHGIVQQSQPKPAAFQRHIIVDDSHRENLLCMLIIEPNTDNTAGHLLFPGKFRLLVHPSKKRFHEFIPPIKD
jgi:hypothetical protein